MIDWNRTKEEFDYGPECLDIFRPKIIVRCNQCNRDATYTVRVKSKIQDNNLEWFCPKCVANRSDVRKSISEAKRKAWENGRAPKPPEMTSELKEKIGKSAKKYWEDKDELKKKYSKKYRDLYSSKDYRQTRSEHSKKLWENSKFKEKVAVGNQTSNRVKSSIQLLAENYLKDLKIDFVPEKQIGFYNVDLFLPKYNLIIELHGDYWHNLNNNKERDKRKYTYIEKYFPQYSLKILWEHEFFNKDRILSLFRYWTGTQYKLEDFDFDNIKILNISTDEANRFMEKYHYKQKIGLGGLKFGAFVENDLASVAIYSPITRKEIATKQNISHNNILELSRFCIHPKYQKKNFGSWFVSNTIKLAFKQKPNVKMLVSFADTTYNHSGTIYKASNWIKDGVVKPDYWYVDNDGYVMHKKTLYNHAKSLRMTEREFAEKHNYSKVIGKEKLRFIYKR